MKANFDKEADAVYIYLTDPSVEIYSGFTYLCDSKEIGGMINLDFDNDKVLTGIEIMDASKKLPLQILENTSQNNS